MNTTVQALYNELRGIKVSVSSGSTLACLCQTYKNISPGGEPLVQAS